MGGSGRPWDVIVLDDILSRYAGALPTVGLRTGHAATRILWDDDRVNGVQTAENCHTYDERATLVVGADGRHSWMPRQVQAAEYERIRSPKANFIADYANTSLGGQQPESAAFAEYHAARDAALAADWDVTYGAIMRQTPTARDLREAQVLANRPDLVEQHIEVLRDADAFRRTLDALLEDAD